MDKKKLLRDLRSGLVRIVFEKKDGTERTMLCTLNELLIKNYAATPKGTGIKTSNDEVQSVYDVENNGWRSFRWDSLKDIHEDV